MTTSSALRTISAVVAAGLGLALLGPAGTTMATWHERAAVAATELKSGALELSVSDSSRIQLHSRISPDQRHFRAGAHCTTSQPYRECRDLTTAQLSGQTLVPGDRLVVEVSFTTSATGDNLVAVVSADSADSLRELPPGTTVSTKVSRDGTSWADTGTADNRGSAAASTILWTVRADIITPTRWPHEYADTAITLGAIAISVSQQH